MFWLKFIGLTAIYVTAAIGIMYLIAKKNNTEIWKYLGNNNTPLYVGFGAIAITFIIACFNWGPAVLLPENFPTPAQRAGFQDILNHLWSKTPQPPTKIPTEPLPWATGTWFWWKAEFVFILITIAYIPFGLWDEALGAIRKVSEIIKRRHDEALAERRTEHAEALALIKAQNAAGTGKNVALPPAPPARIGFWQFFQWDMLIELGQAVLKSLFRNRV